GRGSPTPNRCGSRWSGRSRRSNSRGSSSAWPRHSVPARPCRSGSRCPPAMSRGARARTCSSPSRASTRCSSTSTARRSAPPRPAREVRARPGTDLQLTEPGAYPLLVNVTGTPVGGPPARLHDARTLLPVLDAPTGAEDLAPPTDDGAEGAGDDGGGDGNDD